MKRGLVSALVIGLVIGLGGCDDKKAGTAPGSGPASAPASASASAPASAPATASASASASAPAPVPDAITAQHVLVAYKGAKDAPKGVTRSKVEAKARAEEVAQKAKGGTDFSELVAQYTDDPGSKDRRGSVGKFTRDKMVKPFADAAFALKVDETSGVVESPYGFHVIKRNQ
jgi:peptidyl-prolyl cis-trans isomerase NIMA-interacting 1